MSVDTAHALRTADSNRVLGASATQATFPQDAESRARPLRAPSWPRASSRRTTTWHPGHGSTQLGAPHPGTSGKGRGHTRALAAGGQEMPDRKSPRQSLLQHPWDIPAHQEDSPQSRLAGTAPGLPRGVSTPFEGQRRLQKHCGLWMQRTERLWEGRGCRGRLGAPLGLGNPQTPPLPHTLCPAPSCPLLPQDPSPRGSPKTPGPAAGAPLPPRWRGNSCVTCTVTLSSP